MSPKQTVRRLFCSLSHTLPIRNDDVLSITCVPHWGRANALYVGSVSMRASVIFYFAFVV